MPGDNAGADNESNRASYPYIFIVPSRKTKQPDFRQLKGVSMSRYTMLGLVGLLGCYQTLPKREAPAVIAPTLVVGPLAPGFGRILVDVVEGPAVVSRAVGASATGTTFERICITPCYVDLPLGVQEVSLVLQKQQKIIRYLPKMASLTFKPEPYAYRASLDRSDFSVKYIYRILLGPSVVPLSLTTFVASLVVYTDERRNLDDPDPKIERRETLATSGFLVVGGAALIGNAALIFWPSKLVKQEGSSVEFALGPEALGTPTNEVGLLGGLVVPPGEREEKAEAIYRQAEAYYHIQDYESALKGFQEAYLLSQAPDLLLNIGQCYRRMKRNEEAITSYRTYLQIFPDSPYRAEIEGMLNDLSPTK
jgi:hypothetical protein